MTLRRTTLLMTLLLILAGCDGGGEKNDKAVKTAPPKRSSADWYIRIVAEDPLRGLKSSDAQLGELTEENATVHHTLKALNPFGGRYLDVVFKDPEGVESGEYKVHFKTADSTRQNRWTFTVRTDDPDAEIILSWKGLYLLTPYRDDANRTRYKEFRSRTDTLISRMKLVDLSSEEAYAVADGPKAARYRFSMNGLRERSFQWVLEADPVAAPLPPKTPEKSLKKPAHSSDDGFDLESPPEFKEER